MISNNGKSIKEKTYLLYPDIAFFLGFFSLKKLDDALKRDNIKKLFYTNNDKRA